MGDDKTANNSSERQPSQPITPALEAKDERSEQEKDGRNTEENAATKAGNPDQLSLFHRFMLRKFPEAKAHDRWTLVFTFVIAVSTFFYTIFAGWTLHEIAAGGTDTHNLAVAAATQASHTEEIAQAAHDQVDAANEISDAADSFADTAEQINTHADDSVAAFNRLARATEQAMSQTEARARMEDRPYIITAARYAANTISADTKTQQAVAVIPNGVDSWLIEIAVDFTIIGHSPAVEMATTPSQIIVGPMEEMYEEAVNYVPVYNMPPKDVKLPGESGTVKTGTATITTEQKNAIANGTWGVYIVGAFEYRDIYKPRLNHSYELIYCYQMTTTGLPFSTCLNNKSRTSQQ